MTFTESSHALAAVPVWESSQANSEAREYPRIALEIPVAFRNGAGQHCAARLRNLSADGLQVRCNIATAFVIHPRGEKLQPDTQPLLHATAVLPLASGTETLSIGVRLARLSQLTNNLGDFGGICTRNVLIEKGWARRKCV